MEIKLSEDLCKLCKADMELASQLGQVAQETMTKAHATMEQAKGIQILVQSRVYKALDLAPVEGDILNFEKGMIIRNDPPAPTEVDALAPVPES